jgi:hypothetical protein
MIPSSSDSPWAQNHCLGKADAEASRFALEYQSWNEGALIPGACYRGNDLKNDYSGFIVARLHIE